MPRKGAGDRAMDQAQDLARRIFTMARTRIQRFVVVTGLTLVLLNCTQGQPQQGQQRSNKRLARLNMRAISDAIIESIEQLTELLTAVQDLENIFVDADQAHTALRGRGRRGRGRGEGSSI